MDNSREIRQLESLNKIKDSLYLALEESKNAHMVIYTGEISKMIDDVNKDIERLESEVII